MLVELFIAGSAVWGISRLIRRINGGSSNYGGASNSDSNAIGAYVTHQAQQRAREANERAQKSDQESARIAREIRERALKHSQDVHQRNTHRIQQAHTDAHRHYLQWHQPVHRPTTHYRHVSPLYKPGKPGR